MDEGPMMLFGEGAVFLPPMGGLAQDDVPARRNKRGPVNLIHRASQSLVLSEVDDGSMKTFVQGEVFSETFDLHNGNFFHGAIDLAQWFQWSGIFQTFGREPGTGAFQDA